MDARLRQLWGGRLYSRLPLLGGWLRSRAVQKLADDDSPEAVRLLAEAVTRTEDNHVRIEALEVLQEVERPRCVEAACSVWAETRHPLLEQLMLVRDWLPLAPVGVRLLYLLRHSREDEAAAGGAEVVGPLRQLCGDREEQVARRARRVLAQLATPEAREALCDAVLEDDPLARAIALEAGYAPGAAGRRALFYFLTGQWEAYEALDFDHALLRAAYQAAGAELRQRIASAARQAGRVEWVEVVTNGRQTLRLGEMSDAEWQVTLDVLVGGAQWVGLWRLAQEAPPRWAARLLQRLPPQAGPDHDREEREQLARLAVAWEEPDLSGLLRPALTLTTQSVTPPVLSPDNRLLIVGEEDGSIRLWELPDGRPLDPLTGHRAGVTCLALSPRGKVLVSGDEEGAVRFWNVSERRALQTYVRPWHEGEVTCVAISPHVKVAVSGGRDGMLRLWGLPDGALLHSMKGYVGSEHGLEGVVGLAVSPDGQLLASAGTDVDGDFRLWRLPEGRRLRTLDGLTNGFTSLAFSPDGRLLASSQGEKAVQVWEVAEGGASRTLEGHANRVRCLAISPDCSLLASGSSDESICLWGLPEGQRLHALAGHTAEVGCLAISPDGRVLASGSLDQTIELWGLPDGRPLRTLKGLAGPVSSLAVASDGQLLVSFEVGGTVRLWISDLMRLSRVPAGRFSAADMAQAQDALGDETLRDAERRALAFIVALARHRRRFDVYLDTAPRRIAVGEFDIELAG